MKEPVTKMTFTNAKVAALKPVAGKQLRISDTVEPHLYLRLNYGGRKPKVWRALAWVNGRQKWKTLGQFPAIDVKAARKAAGEFLQDPEGVLHRASIGSFDEVAEEFVRRHVDKVGKKREPSLRSRHEIVRHLKYASEKIGTRKFGELKRRDVTKLLDQIEEERGTKVADQVLATLRKLFRWYALRDDTFSSPMIPGMRRGKPVKRERILTDEEITALWQQEGQFADFCKVLLLTGQRRAKVQTMRWDDLSPDGTWTLRTEAGEKKNTGSLKLPQAVLDILARQTRLTRNPYVFAASRGHGAVCGFNKRVAALRRNLADPGWTLHDLRRSARSLMTCAGVSSDVAERVLGHTIPGVAGVYNRHDYAAEKAEALDALANLIETEVTVASCQEAA